MNATAPMFSAVSFTVVARVIILAAGVLASVLTARGLGVEGRGQYYAIMTLAAIIAQFGNLGLSSSNTYLAAQDPEHAWPLAVNSVWVSLTLGFSTALMVMLAGDALAARLGVPPALTWALCVIAPAMLSFTLCSSVLVASGRFFAMNIWSIVNAVLVLIGVALCALAQAGSGVFLIATLFAAVIAASGLVIDVGRGLNRDAGWLFDVGRLRASVQFASRAYLALLAGFLIQRVGVAFLVADRGAMEVGVYSIAAQISDVLIIVPTSMAMVLFPALVRDPDNAWRKTRQMILLVVAIMLLISASVWLLGEPVIKAVFGREFTGSFHILLWMFPGILATSVTGILSQFIVAQGFPRSLVALWIAGLALCLATGLPLVNALGAIGAAQSQSLGAVAVCLGVIALAVRRHRLALKSNLRA